jgi:hypothetical protein
MSSCQCILSDLIHDVAQPLSNIETSAYCLGRIIDPEDPRAQEHLRMIQQQLDTASAMLSAVAAELRRRNAERVEASPAFWPLPPQADTSGFLVPQLGCVRVASCCVSSDCNFGECRTP